MTTYDRDALIRLALTPADTVQAPADLGDDILGAIRDTPQHRPLIPVGALRWLPAPSRSLALAALLALLVAGAAIVALSQRPSVPPLLSMYHGGPDRTGVMPGPGPVGEPVVAWEAERRGQIRFTVMPLVAAGRVFVADQGGYLAALDQATGDLLWEQDVGSPIVSSPALYSDLVITGSDTGLVSAYDVASGERRWTFQAEGRVSASLAIVGDDMFIGTEDGILHVVAVPAGVERWRFEARGPITRGPAIADGLILVGTSDGWFQAIDVATHQRRWERDLRPGGIGTPAVAGGRVFFGHGLEGDGIEGELRALDVATGDDAWAAPPRVATSLQLHAAAIGRDRVFAVSTDRHVYAFDRSTGARLWLTDTGAPTGALAGLVGDVLYVCNSEARVMALDVATGAILWDVELEGDPTMPVVVGGRVYVGSSFGTVTALEDAPAPSE